MTSLRSHIDFARRLTQVMDMRFRVLGIRFGVDPLLDIIPGFGNVLSTVTSFYLFWIAYKLGVPGRIYVTMAWNLCVDYMLGVFPFIGIVFDLFFRANVRNFNMLEKFFDPDIIEGEIIEG